MLLETTNFMWIVVFVNHILFGTMSTFDFILIMVVMNHTIFYCNLIIFRFTLIVVFINHVLWCDILAINVLFFVSAYSHYFKRWSFIFGTFSVSTVVRTYPTDPHGPRWANFDLLQLHNHMEYPSIIKRFACVILD